MQIKLLVIRTADIKMLAEFYALPGFSFHYHKHDNSPFHYAATIGQLVLEIYPLAKGQDLPDKHLRLGFSLENFDAITQALKDAQVPFVTAPVQSESGYMAVIADPDGRKIELYKD